MSDHEGSPTRRTSLWAAAAGLLAATVLALGSLGADPVLADSTSPSPASSPDSSPTASPSSSATPEPAPSPTVVATPTATEAAASPAPRPGPAVPPPAPGSADIVVEGHLLADVIGAYTSPRYQAPNAPLRDVESFQLVRVRFRLHNTGSSTAMLTPQLEFARESQHTFVAVPETPLPGLAFHLDREWVPDAGALGLSRQGPAAETISVGDALITTDSGTDSGQLYVGGHHSMAANPDRALTLPPAAAAEQEFTVRVSTAARYLTGYQLRLTDRGTPLAQTGSSAGLAVVRLGAPPPLRLSPGQRQGVPVVDPLRSTPARYPLLAVHAQAVTLSVLAPATSTTTGSSPGPLRYALVGSSLTASTVTSSSIQGPYSMASDECAQCHRTHAAPEVQGLTVSGPRSSLCFTCHDGSGSGQDVNSQYGDSTVPADNPDQREYYRHDALAPSNHTLSKLDEFGGVSNRHSECVDCHNSHQARGTDTTQTSDGWTASGRLAGTSGVSVVNGAAGTDPTYTFLDGEANVVTLEYQLCLKCHSGYTVLPSNSGFSPSRYALDKGVELNPANDSFHPVEAQGTNQTTKMGDNLAGTSPYKLWNFTAASTIRCADCHTGSRNATASPAPAAGDDLSPHTSSYRGLLLRNYRDRVLMSKTEAYSAGNFALCFSCHAEAPYATQTAVATNFTVHGKHLTMLSGLGSGGTDIDTLGAGQGNAICAECHFRLHSTTYKVGAQTVDGTRLVNFAPNVRGNGGASTSPRWTRGATSGGTCTLTCHGYTHDGAGY